MSIGGGFLEHDQALFRNAVWGHLQNPISRENEEAVCRSILDGCTAALAGYATTIEEVGALQKILFEGLCYTRIYICAGIAFWSGSDLAGYKSHSEVVSEFASQDVDLLNSSKLSTRKEIATVVRLGEKRVLQELQLWSENRVANLDKLEYYAERRLKDLGLVDDGGVATPWVIYRETKLWQFASCICCEGLLIVCQTVSCIAGVQ